MSAYPAHLPANAARVLDFWFSTIGHPEHGRFRTMWFVQSDATDREIAQRFGDLVEQALRGSLATWALTPHGALALILLLDQFTRNIFRGTPRAFEGDVSARALAQVMVEGGHDRTLPALMRAFVYLPFEHAEDLASQDEAVRLFDALAAEDAALDTMRDYAERHRDAIRRFGRFPHRNAVLGRASTADEATYLQQPGAGF